MVQAIRLLQLNAMEMEQEISQELEENPFLELADDEDEEDGRNPADNGAADDDRDNGDTEPEADVDDGLGEVGDIPDRIELEAGSAEGDDGLDGVAVEVSPIESAEESPEPPELLEKPDQTEENDPEIDEYYQETYDDTAFATAERGTDDRDMTQLDSAGTTLYDHLLRQLHVTELDERGLELGEYLIGNIDTNGYLTMPVEEIAEHFETTVEEIEKVLTVIQTFDPTGVGARDIRECLMIQIRSMAEPDESLLTLVRDHFDDIAHRRHRQIARAMKITEKRAVDLCERISHLEPKPGRAVSNESPQYILPDVVVNKIDGKYYIALNEGRTNHLRVSSYYRQKFQSMISSRGKGSVDADGVDSAKAEADTEYIKKKFNDAVVLIRNIERRKGTILKIAHSIMERQSDFLEKGIEHLHPMTLKDIAEEVGMHEATVSRVTSNKWVETPRGTFRLKYFFSSGLETDDGESQSSRSIRNRIQEMIEAENRKRPLSDQKIADTLKAEGIKIARRTVTKYREQMKILPTNMRRQG
jgi:RNA polymerase sigma-54 factor